MKEKHIFKFNGFFFYCIFHADFHHMSHRSLISQLMVLLLQLSLPNRLSLLEAVEKNVVQLTSNTSKAII